MRSQGLLQIGSKGEVFEKELISTLVMSPFAFGSTPGFSLLDGGRIASELVKKDDFPSLIFADEKGPRWYDVSWKFDREIFPLGLFPTEVTIKMFNSKEYQEKGLVDFVSSRKIRVIEANVGNKNLPAEFFRIPVSKASSLINYDVSDQEIPVNR